MKATIVLLALALSLASCTTTSRGPRKPQDPGDQWVLARVELDRAAVQHPERRFPLFDPPTASSFGREAYAIGDMGISQEGRVAVTTRIMEPVQGRSLLPHPLLTFSGRLSPDGKRIVDPTKRPAGRSHREATWVSIDLDKKNEVLRLQGFHGDEPHPYILYFTRSAVEAQPVPMPTR